MFFLVVGNRFRTRHEGTTAQVITCPSCGFQSHFERKSGRQFLTLFFVLPVLPLGGRREFVECPRCHAQLESSERRSYAA